MIRSPLLSDLPGVAHGFFTREGGVSEGIYASLNIGLGSRDDRDRVMANRGRVATALGVAPDRLAMPYQIHSPEVVVVEEAWAPGEGPKADAVVTARPGVAVGVATADCGPILFADARARVVGAAHAGWQGAFHGVIEATVAAMEGLGATRGGITAVLGPTISGEAYEVGPEFVERFVGSERKQPAPFGSSDHGRPNPASRRRPTPPLAQPRRVDDMSDHQLGEQPRVHEGQPLVAIEQQHPDFERREGVVELHEVEIGEPAAGDVAPDLEPAAVRRGTV